LKPPVPSSPGAARLPVEDRRPALPPVRQPPAKTIAPPSPPPPAAPRLATPRQRLLLAAGLACVLLAALWLFSPILTPFVLAAVIAYFLDPVAMRLAWLGVPRGLASLLLVLALALAALLCVLLLYPLLVAQVTILLQRLPSYVVGVGQAVRQAFDAVAERVGPEFVDQRLQELAVGQVGAIVSFLGTAVGRLVGGGVALFNVFTFVTVTPVVTFYLLRDWPRAVVRVDAWLPRRSAATLRQLARETDRVLSAWLRGQLLCCGLLAVYYATALSAVGLELGVTVGLVSGILTFIPYVGSTTGLLASTLLALAQFGTWGGVLTVVGVYVAGQVVEGYIIYPRLLGERVELHAVWVIFALFAGGVALGFLGVLLAVPMAATLGVVARFWLRRYLESPLYLDPPRTGR
jgi:predicted PurR-regulated permease PerM